MYDKDLITVKKSKTLVKPHYLEKRYLESNLKWMDSDYGSDLDYWLEDSASDEIVSEISSPNQKSLEAVEDNRLDNWVSDDEESLQLYEVHPEVIPTLHPDSWSERVNIESDKDKILCQNQLSHCSSSTSSDHKDPSDITVDSSSADNSPNLV